VPAKITASRDATVMDGWGRVFRLAARQHSAIARSQAVDLGVSDSTFTRRVRREQWAEPHRKVYLVPGSRPGFLTEVSAALLAAGGAALTTGCTALHLRGVIEAPPRHIQLVVPHTQRASTLAGVETVRSRTLHQDDRSTVHSLATATAARAFLDAAAGLEHSRLRALLIDARQRRVVTPAEVIERIAALSARVPGRNRLLEAAADVDAVGADSVLSDTVHRRLLAEGLSPDPRPVAVEVGGGRRLRPDITFSPSRVCIECDSLAHHSSQRAIDIDHRKDQAYADANWKCVRIGWHRFDTDWPSFVALLRRALDEWPQIVAARAA
jgi:hypothetical protein